MDLPRTVVPVPRTLTTKESRVSHRIIPTYGSLIAAINFDLSEATRIGKTVLKHSFMLPGAVATAVAVIAGLGLAKIMF
jgi:anaerobic C4-dicarboxylate transporter